MRRLTKKYRQELYEYIRKGGLNSQSDETDKDLDRLAEFIIAKKVNMKEREKLLDTYSYYYAKRQYKNNKHFSKSYIEMEFEFDGIKFCHKMTDGSYICKNMVILRSHKLGLFDESTKSYKLLYVSDLHSRPPYSDELFREPTATKLVEDKRVDIFPEHQPKLKRNMQGNYNRFDLMEF